MELKIYHSIIYGNLKPLTEQPPDDYPEISHLLDNLPPTLPEIESRLFQIIGNSLTLNFDTDKPINISQYLTNPTYTPVLSDYFPPEISLFLPPPQTPAQRFYYFIITTEAQRIKLRLLQYADILQDDICAKQEVIDILRLLARYATSIHEHPLSNPIFNFLLTQIIKLYFELTLLFDVLLSEKDYISFSDFYALHLNRQPAELETTAYQKAIHIRQAQQLYNNFDNAIAINLLTQLYSEFSTGVSHTPTSHTSTGISHTPTTLIFALENALFLHHIQQTIPPFEQIITPQFAAQTIKEQKTIFRQRYEREEVAIDRANTIDEIITELSINDIFKINDNRAIAHNLLSFLYSQKEIYLKEPSAVFKVVIEKQTTDLKKKPQPTIKPMQIKTKIAIAHRHLAFLNGVNPNNNQRIMPETDYTLLVGYVEHLIQTGTIPTITRKIPKCNISKTWLRYTLYLIHQELYTSIQDVWIEFLQTVFNEFSPYDVEFSTIKTKFSQPPSGYAQFVKKVIA